MLHLIYTYTPYKQCMYTYDHTHTYVYTHLEELLLSGHSLRGLLDVPLTGPQLLDQLLLLRQLILHPSEL